MARTIQQSITRVFWALVRTQHGAVTRSQLLQFGYSRDAIAHRIATGRLHPIWPGVYAVGRAELTKYGRWMAATLACGPGALLSHDSAGALREIAAERGPVHVTVTAVDVRLAGIVIHRRRDLPERDRDKHLGIPVTSPGCTLVDIASRLERDDLEAAIREADKRNVVDPETLRAELERHAGRPGVAALRTTLDRRTFALTDSQLERRFLPIARRAGLHAPLTQEWVNGHRVDFFWPDLRLVVETDGLRYHRTPAQQALDRERDQAHAAAGLTPLRFTHGQIEFEPARVERTLAAVARRLS